MEAGGMEGLGWCFPCITIYMAAASKNEEFREWVRNRTEAAVAADKPYILITPPPAAAFGLRIMPAVCIGSNWLLPYLEPTGVCLAHVAAFEPDNKGLSNGKPPGVLPARKGQVK
jgi:hypothetical protein